MKTWKTLAAAVLLGTAVICAGTDSPWGIAAHPHAAKEWENIDRQLGMMRDAGMTSLRHDMKFSRIAAKKGQYDFNSYDELLEKLDQYGMEYLPILEGYDWEISKSRPDAVPLYRHPEEWRAFVRACARHYRGKLKVWEIWNEPDGGFWKPDPNAAQFVPLLKIAYEELKAADPENVVMVGGLCGWNVGYLRDMYAVGAKGYFDAIAVHPYGWGVDRSAFQRKRMEEFKTVLAEHGDEESALWITECGGATNRSNLIAQQPDVLIRAIGAAARKIGRKLPPQLVVGAPVSREHPDRDFEPSRNWLPNAKLIPVTPEELAEADPEKLPVFLGCEHTAIEESYKEPMLEYVRKGGILLAFGEVPFYYVRYRNEQGNWSSRSAAGELHPYYGIGYQAWWTKPGIPKSASRTLTTATGKEVWHDSVVQKMLCNEKYIGDALLQKTYIADLFTRERRINNGELPKYYVHDCHPAIIDRDTFQKVQEEMARRSSLRKTSSKTKTELGKYCGKYVLSELLVCGECGSPYRRVIWTQKGVKRVVWRCQNRLEHGKKLCKHSPTWDEADIHSAVVSAMNELFQMQSAKDELKASLAAALAGEGSELSLPAVEAQIRSLQTRQLEIFQLIVGAGADCTDYDEELQQVNITKTRLMEQKAELERTRQTAPEFERRMEELNTAVDGTCAALTDFDELTVRQLVSNIKVLDRDGLLIRFKDGTELVRQRG